MKPSLDRSQTTPPLYTALLLLPSSNFSTQYKMRQSESLLKACGTSPELSFCAETPITPLHVLWMTLKYSWSRRRSPHPSPHINPSKPHSSPKYQPLFGTLLVNPNIPHLCHNFRSLIHNSRFQCTLLISSPFLHAHFDKMTAGHGWPKSVSWPSGLTNIKKSLLYSIDSTDAVVGSCYELTGPWSMLLYYL